MYFRQSYSLTDYRHTGFFVRQLQQVSYKYFHQKCQDGCSRYNNHADLHVYFSRVTKAIPLVQCYRRQKLNIRLFHSSLEQRGSEKVFIVIVSKQIICFYRILNLNFLLTSLFFIILLFYLDIVAAVWLNIIYQLKKLYIRIFLEPSKRVEIV